MSNTRKAATVKRPAAKRAPVKGKGQQAIPLVIPIPGGLAHFYRPGDLTPRRTRELGAIGGELLPRMGQLATAQKITVNGQTVDESGVLQGMPVGMTRDEIRVFMEFQEACAFAYLESWTIDRELPSCPDDFQDLPRSLYNPIIEHSSKLAFSGGDAQFSVDALPESEDEADPDLPTSPSAA